ncbi:MAG: rRNA maturation RNase YbeY [Porticoccaceae bacterium]|nr:rRNA maturation RNase YbeY [Porticoccaceae bacterium]MDG1474449.1 rRNA maturation RNase YbeY [Porticoccaceae bacterium]
MAINIDIQRICPLSDSPSDADIQLWVKTALDQRESCAELSIRIVNKSESAALNHQYRGKQGATNVLSFPFDAVIPVPLPIPILGDVVICAPVVSKEASQQGKIPQAHWAHMVIHGVLHLLGYDHVEDEQAQIMEQLETDILLSLGYPAPYTEIHE